MRGSGRPVWDDETADDDLAVLHRSDEPPRTCDVLVVGGGIIGLAIAATCTARGMDVVLVERAERLAGGASGRAAGGLAADAHPQAGPEWHRYARRSMELHRELDAKWHYGLETLDLRVVDVGVVPQQARVDPLAMAAALARNTGTIVTNAATLDISAAAVVDATGCEQTPTAVKGHLIATEPALFKLGEIVATVDSEFLALQLPSGRIVAGGTKDVEDEEPNVRDATVERIRAKLVDVVPDARDLAVSHAWTCFRPKARDELPIVDRVGERSFVATGFYSTGILMAPVAGELVADALGGAPLPEAFSARRFR
jgi:glycine/D-amino acid oxidase-like deaminating enzyme